MATNTVWASGASYIVTNTIVVPEGVTLAMGAGTVVAFDAGQGLTVNGRVLAEGSSNAPVLFTRSPANGTRWGGVLINGTVGSLESQFVNSRFEFNGNIAIHSVGGTLLLEGVTFGTTDRQYVSLDGSSFLLSHCYFPSSSTPFELVHGSGGIKGGGRGIVRNCFFGTTTGYNDIIDFTGGNRPGQPIFQCYNNVFAGSGDDILDLDGTDAWIEGNIFLHCHRNGSPDSASAVSGGDYGSETSQVTIIGNLFYDCDQAATAKQGNFFVIMNNTIARITNAGGEDSAAGVVNVRDVDLVPPTTFAAGLFLEGNIIVDADQLVRNYVAGETTVTWTNNILPRPWDGPGGSNTLADPLLSHIPVLSETFFTNWSDAQIFRSWFSPQPGSPAIGTGPNGTDKGGVIPLGASLSGAPEAVTTRRDATLWVGINRSGNGIPPLGWPEGAGYTHYRWRFDGAEWSGETAITNPISLSGLSLGAHYVEVTGKRDSGTYQDDPELGPNARVTRSRLWTVFPLQLSLQATSEGVLSLHFLAEAGRAYVVESRDDASFSIPWRRVADVAAQSVSKDYALPINNEGNPVRYYRLVLLSQ